MSESVIVATEETRSPGRWHTLGRFAWHYLEMALAMFASMAILEPVWRMIWPALANQPAADALVMAFDMSVGMAVAMRLRRHSWSDTFEMCAWMSAPFVALLPAFWAGWIDGPAILEVGHLLMMVTMLACMVRQWRRPVGHALSSGPP